MKYDKKDGIMTRAFVNLNGKEIELKLAVIKRTEKHFGSEEELSFVSNERPNPVVVTRSFYSGGMTGAGIDSWTIREAFEEKLKRPPVIVLSEGLEAIIKWLDDQDAKAKQKREDYIKEQDKKTERLNAQPKQFPVEGLSFVRIKRSTAEFSASRSRNIQYGTSVEIKKDGEWKDCYMNFTTKDGKLQVKRFKDDMVFLFGEEKAAKLDARETLKKIVDARNSVKDLLRSIA